MADLLLIGGGGHCEAVIDVIEKSGQWQIAGILDSNDALTAVSGYPVLGTDEQMPKLSKHVRYAVVTLGQILTFKVRKAVFERLQQHGFSPATIISPLAEVSSRAIVGAGSVVMHFASIGPGAEVGENCIINTRSLIEHGARVGRHSHVSTSAVLNGNAAVGDGTFIGSASVIREATRIGDRCVVGMGAVVTKDIADDSTYLGGRR